MEDKYEPFYTNVMNLPKNTPLIKEGLNEIVEPKNQPLKRTSQEDVDEFVKKAKENPILKEHGISIEKAELVKFYKIMTVVAVFSLVILTCSFCYLIFSDGFKPVFVDNSTLICEKSIIPACPSIPSCPACNCESSNFTCPAFPTEITIKDLEDILNKTA